MADSPAPELAAPPRPTLAGFWQRNVAVVARGAEV